MNPWRHLWINITIKLALTYGTKGRPFHAFLVTCRGAKFHAQRAVLAAGSKRIRKFLTNFPDCKETNLDQIQLHHLLSAFCYFIPYEDQELFDTAEFLDMPGMVEVLKNYETERAISPLHSPEEWTPEEPVEFSSLPGYTSPARRCQQTPRMGMFFISPTFQINYSASAKIADTGSRVKECYTVITIC